MSEQTDKLISMLKPYGLSGEEAVVYLKLLEKRVSTALALSRLLNLGRTKVYRILDKLIAKEMVVSRLEHGGFKFVANDVSSLNYLLAKKEAEVQALKETLPEVQKSLMEKIGTDVPGSKVMFYRGLTGLSAVNWNLLNARTGILSMEVSTAIAYMPVAEAEKLRQALVDREVFIRTLMNVTHMEPYTKVTKMVKDFWEVRSISEDVFGIKADIFIYNDTFTVCNYLDQGDVFCVEMENKTFANMQRQVFENLWSQARVMRKIGNEGEVRVE